MIHVGLNLVFLVPGETGGMETYARELIARLAATDELRLTAFVNRETGANGIPGVPAAVVHIGLQEHVITPALGAAVTLAALATLCPLGTNLLARRTERLSAPPRAQPSPSPPQVAS